MALLNAQTMAFIFGLLGNIVSFLVFLAPVPTFYNIYRRKSSEGFQAIPYSVAFFSASLLLYYAFIKTNAYMIVSINGFGCIIETVYLAIYLIYATKKDKVSTVRLIVIFNGGGLALVMMVSLLAVHGPKRVSLVGWMCAIINVAVFAAPLSIMRRVIRTKSVEFMPFTLSFFLTLCATMWFFYGFFVSDYYIALPNVLGFLFGIAQMILYFIYKNTKEGDCETNRGRSQGSNYIDMESCRSNHNSREGRDETNHANQWSNYMEMCEFDHSQNSRERQNESTNRRSFSTHAQEKT